MADLVSDIIPNYNRRHELRKCVDSVILQEYEPVEIIVVDDFSQDDTIEYMKSHYQNVNIISSTCRCGPSHLRNKGLNEAKGRFVLFLDSDVVLQNRRILKRMTEKLSRNKEIGEIGGEIPVYLGIENEARGKKLNFYGENYPVVSVKSDKGKSRMRRCTYLATCNCMVRRKVAELVGGFDPYYNFGGEDVDFGFAVQKKGYTNWVDFEVAVHHRHSSTGRYPDETYRYHFTRIRFNMKHFSLARISVIFCRDFMNVIWFYLLLIPKIITKALRREKLLPENFLGGCYILKSYLENVLNYSQIRKAKEMNFLSKVEMAKFEAHVASKVS